VSGGQELKTEYGCLFCRSGSEGRLVAELERYFPEVKTVIPRKKRIRRMGGQAFEEEVTLFPGYVFFRVEADSMYRPRLLTRARDAYRVLVDADGSWRLSGVDRVMAETLFGTEGVVGFSKAYFQGDRIRILDGLLKAYEGCIERVNKRARTAQIRIDLQGKIMRVWLGYELIEREDSPGNDAAPTAEP